MLSAFFSRSFGRGVACDDAKASWTCSIGRLWSLTLGVVRDAGAGTTNRFAGVTRFGSTASSKGFREAIAGGLGV